MSEGKLSLIFSNPDFAQNSPNNGDKVCQDEPTEMAQSLGDDTHAVVTQPKEAREHGLHRGVVRSYFGSSHLDQVDGRCSNAVCQFWISA